MRMERVIVIGGGAAGMMAAIAAADSGNSVFLLEKNEKLGKKIYITGKGRCNVTNAADRETVFANVCRNRKFLYSAFHGFDNYAMMDFLEKAGCPLKVERGERVFPVSDHSSDIISALSREIKRRNVQIMLHSEVKDILTEKPEGQECGKTINRLERVSAVRLADGKEIAADRIVICTGGMSYQTTGSTGDGYRFALKTGHRVTDRVPGLVPLMVEEAWCSQLMGLSLKNVTLKLVCDKKEVFNGFGEMLFTHFGISGPLALSASSFYQQDHEKAKVYLDLKPALDFEQLDKRLLRDFDENKNRQFKNALGGLFPAKLIPVMITLSEITPEKKVNAISREERYRLVTLIKNLPMTVTGTRGFEEAIITRGGVSVKDVNPSTMESKLVEGLFFAGEVLDLDALTGGYNLQIAWSTGYLAGKGKNSKRSGD